MNQIEIDKVNKSLYSDARIFWEPNKGYTSHLWKFLQLNGYSVKSSKGIYTVYDYTGKKVLTAIGKTKMLVELAKLFR